MAARLFDADVTLVSLEGPIVDGPQRRLALRRDEAPVLTLTPADFDALCGGGRFDVVATATNHAFDAGLAGVRSTLDALERRGVLTVGTSRSAEEAARPRLLDRGGVRLGFVAATFGVNGNVPPAEAAHAVDLAPLNALDGQRLGPALAHRIRACRAAGAQLVVASLHWGHEFELAPRARQRQLAQELVDLGVDVVWGHHPHVIQPMELLSSSSEPGRVGVVFYSLGSVTKPLNLPAYALAALARVEVAIERDGRAGVEAAELVPIVQVVELDGDRPRASVSRLTDLRDGTDPALVAFLDQPTRQADHVLGPGWRVRPDRGVLPPREQHHGRTPNGAQEGEARPHLPRRG